MNETKSPFKQVAVLFDNDRQGRRIGDKVAEPVQDTLIPPGIKIVQPSTTKPTQEDKAYDQAYIVEMLLESPTYIANEQILLDKVNREYQARIAKLSIEALSKPLFPGKKPEDGMRAASNDTERDLAIQLVLTSDPELVELTADREDFSRQLAYYRNRFEGAKIAAQFLSSMKV